MQALQANPYKFLYHPYYNYNDCPAYLVCLKGSYKQGGITLPAEIAIHISMLKPDEADYRAGTWSHRACMNSNYSHSDACFSLLELFLKGSKSL